MAHPTSQAAAWRRSVKRKLDGNPEHNIPLRPSSAPAADVLARVETENECSALRETLASQQQTIQELCREIDEERNASSSATSEAMSMILRLQREKAEVQMESRQFKRYAEEKMAHDQHQIALLEDALYKVEQEMHVLSFELQSYKHRLASYGAVLDSEKGSDSIDGSSRVVYDYPASDYPYLKCKMPDVGGSDGINHDVDNFGSSSTPCSNVNVSEKEVVIGDSPRRPEHERKFSAGSSTSFLNREIVEEHGESGKQQEEFPVVVDRASDAGGDDMSDRVYTVDAVHGVAPQPSNASVGSEYVSVTRNSMPGGDVSGQNDDIKNLYMRLQALEVDRESLKQAIVSMQAENAQLVLLKEIALNLSKGMVQPAPERRIVKKPSLFGSLSFMSMFKWVASFIFWRKKSTHIKYQFGLPNNNNVGLLLLLKNTPCMHQWRCLTRRRG